MDLTFSFRDKKGRTVFSLDLPNTTTDETYMILGDAPDDHLAVRERYFTWVREAGSGYEWCQDDIDRCIKSVMDAYAKYYPKYLPYWSLI